MNQYIIKTKYLALIFAVMCSIGAIGNSAFLTLLVLTPLIFYRKLEIIANYSENSAPSKPFLYGVSTGFIFGIIILKLMISNPNYFFLVTVLYVVYAGFLAVYMSKTKFNLNYRKNGI